MWFVISAVIIVLVFILITKSGKSETATVQAELSQASAKRPDAFKELFREEFPDFASDITFTKSKALLDEYVYAQRSDEFKTASSAEQKMAS